MPGFLGYAGAAVLKSLPLRWIATYQASKPRDFIPLTSLPPSHTTSNPPHPTGFE